MNNHYPLYSKWRYIAGYIFDICGEFPKNVRLFLADRMANFSLDVLERIIKAIHAKTERRYITSSQPVDGKIMSPVTHNHQSDIPVNQSVGAYFTRNQRSRKNDCRLNKIIQETDGLKEQFLSFRNLYSAWGKAFRATKTYESCAVSLINNAIYGLPLPGAKIVPSMVRIRRENFTRCFKKRTKWERVYQNSTIIDYQRYLPAMASLLFHRQHWNSKELLKRQLPTHAWYHHVR